MPPLSAYQITVVRKRSETTRIKPRSGNALKAGLLSYDFKLPDGRTVDHLKTKAPARAGAKYQGVRTEQSQKPQLTPSPDDAAGST